MINQAIPLPLASHRLAIHSLGFVLRPPRGKTRKLCGWRNLWRLIRGCRPSAVPSADFWILTARRTDVLSRILSGTGFKVREKFPCVGRLPRSPACYFCCNRRTFTSCGHAPVPTAARRLAWRAAAKTPTATTSRRPASRIELLKNNLIRQGVALIERGRTVGAAVLRKQLEVASCQLDLPPPGPTVSDPAELFRDRQRLGGGRRGSLQVQQVLALARRHRFGVRHQFPRRRRHQLSRCRFLDGARAGGHDRRLARLSCRAGAGREPRRRLGDSESGRRRSAAAGPGRQRSRSAGRLGGQHHQSPRWPVLLLHGGRRVPVHEDRIGGTGGGCRRRHG